MEITFWGVRGSAPCFSRDKVHFGTNTSCLEVRENGGERLLFDSGTGLVALGDRLEKSGFPNCEVIHLFFSHFHWDHIQGLPFFKPVYRKGTRLIIYGRQGVESVLTSQLVPPFCPIPMEAVGAELEFVAIQSPVTLGPFVVTPFPLHHPQGSLGYRVETETKKAVYATDTEPDGGEMDILLRERCRGADVLVMDSNNSLEEAARRRGWGHSTWRDCVHVARDAGVKTLVLNHHDAFQSDESVHAKEAAARVEFPSSLCAYEGLTLKV
jgi:phosphoribosyl 1,2-cyclic phosphodiesterase